jgi:hypothetical protein
VVLVILLEKENLGEILTDEEIKKIVSAGFSAPLEYVRTVHFNQRLPELKNIYKPSLNNGNVKIHDGNKWKTVDQEKIINNLYDKSKDLVEDKIEGIEDTKGYKIMSTRTWLDEDNNNPNSKNIKGVKKNIKLELHNNKDILEN